jgi:putative tryptophan/tyrosine transport system substrate-binding protein
MRRRSFIPLVGGAVVWPLVARAQHAGRLPIIGFLGASTRLSWNSYVAAFERRLGELGWIDGHSIGIEYRWAEGRDDRYAEIAAEFVRLKVNVILTSGGAVHTVKQATSVIPIVFAIAVDPVGSGLVNSLSRPGGNATGLFQQPEVAGKRLELLREVVPDVRRLAILANAGYPAAVLEMREVHASARTIGLTVDTFEIRRAEDIEDAFGLLKGHADALYVCAEPLVNANRGQINTLALAAHLSTIHGNPENAKDGGLMYYGPEFLHLFARAADYVDKILKGTNPGDIPVEQPTKFELVVNLKTAKALGLTIPESFLLRADEVIE